MRKFLIAGALAMSACTTTGMSDTNYEAAGRNGSPTASTPAQYVAMAGASDLYEIESSRLALERSSAPQVQQFARLMIDHHTNTTRTVMDAARQAGVNPAPPQLMPMQRDMIAQLRGMNGASFERAYLSQQRQAHQMALTLHSGFAEQGSSEPLRQAARTAVPIIQNHIERLRSLPN